MELRMPPRLESRNTEEFLPTANVVGLEGADQLNEYQEPIKSSRLPYHIARHRKMADSCFEHARSKEHGLKHIDLRKGFLALFWIGVFLVVTAILISMITGLIQSYVAMPVATQIKAEQDPFEFPDISVCAKAPFYTSHVNGTGTNETMDDLLRSIHDAVLNKMKDASVKVTTNGIQSALLIQMATRQDDTFLRAYQHLIYCRYDDQPCSFYNFTELVHLRYVQCFTFSPSVRQVSGGKGLQFIFYKRRSNQKPFVMLNDLEDSAFSDDVNDGINVLVHNPQTFPTYAINNMPTSFPLRYGQRATIEVSGLKYRSDMSGRKSCIINKDPYRYTNFRGGANFLEYRYTYEDCIANMKQKYIMKQCNCYSDRLFVPFDGDDPLIDRSVLDSNTSATEFCRDIRQKTSQRLREEFLCFNQYDKMPTTSVLDQYVPMDKLYATRNDLDARKIERHAVCSLLCEKTIYATRFFEITDMDESITYPATILSTYIKQLEASQLEHGPLQNLWDNMLQHQSGQDPTTTSGESQNDSSLFKLNSQDLIILDIRMATELIDAWEEELTESLFNLISNLGGTLGLCAGISFLSSFFLLVFFGRAFIHALLSMVLWFWWAVYLGKPPAAVLKKTPVKTGDGQKPLSGDYDSDNDSENHTSNTKDIDYFRDVRWKVLQAPVPQENPQVSMYPVSLQSTDDLRTTKGASSLNTENSFIPNNAPVDRYASGTGLLRHPGKTETLSSSGMLGLNNWGRLGIPRRPLFPRDSHKGPSSSQIATGPSVPMAETSQEPWDPEQVTNQEKQQKQHQQPEGTQNRPNPMMIASPQKLARSDPHTTIDNMLLAPAETSMKRDDINDRSADQRSKEQAELNNESIVPLPMDSVKLKSPGSQMSLTIQELPPTQHPKSPKQQLSEQEEPSKQQQQQPHTHQQMPNQQQPLEQEQVPEQEQPPSPHQMLKEHLLPKHHKPKQQLPSEQEQSPPKKHMRKHQRSSEQEHSPGQRYMPNQRRLSEQERSPRKKLIPKQQRPSEQEQSHRQQYVPNQQRLSEQEQSHKKKHTRIQQRPLEQEQSPGKQHMETQQRLSEQQQQLPGHEQPQKQKPPKKQLKQQKHVQQQQQQKQQQRQPSIQFEQDSFSVDERLVENDTGDFEQILNRGTSQNPEQYTSSTSEPNVSSNSTSSSSDPSSSSSPNILTDRTQTRSQVSRGNRVNRNITPTLVQTTKITRDSVFRLDTDETPPYFYEPPPPPLIRESLNLDASYKIYIPEESIYATKNLLPELIDQDRVPRYIRSQYGDPPPYSSLRKWPN